MKRWSNGKYWTVVAANATPARRSAAYDWCDGVMAGPAVTLVKAGAETMKRLTHIGSDGRAQMVDVSAKPLSSRTAVASGKISLQKQTADLIAKNKIAKGNVIATARIAGIQAAKQTAHLIPLCHTIPLSDVKVDIEVFEDGAQVRCAARTIAQTGVEMEALTGVAVALLTIYDMCKAVDRKMCITDVHLVEKQKVPAE